MYAMLTDSIRNKTKIYKNVLIFLKETYFLKLPQTKLNSVFSFIFSDSSKRQSYLVQGHVRRRRCGPAAIKGDASSDYKSSRNQVHYNFHDGSD